MICIFFFLRIAKVIGNKKKNKNKIFIRIKILKLCWSWNAKMTKSKTILVNISEQNCHSTLS